MSIQIKDYHHTALVSKNLDKCKWFYVDVLGFELLDRPDFGFPGLWLQVGPATQLHLQVFEEVIPDTMRHLAFETIDFAETIQTLKSHGVDIIEGPGKRDDGSDFLFCKDPDGNLIEITQH